MAGASFLKLAHYLTLSYAMQEDRRYFKQQEIELYRAAEPEEGAEPAAPPLMPSHGRSPTPPPPASLAAVAPAPAAAAGDAGSLAAGHPPADEA